MGDRPLRILVVGPEDSGKSTLVIHLFYKCGNLIPEAVKILQEQKEKQGKSDKQLLQTLQQGEQGAATPWRLGFKSPKYEVGIAEPPNRGGIFSSRCFPGRKKVDCLLFVVSAAKSDFEASWNLTQAEILIASRLQPKQVVVCVNKMDCSTPTPYDHSRYKDIVGKMSDWLQLWAGDRDPEKVVFLPISALHGDNLLESSAKMPWFRWWELSRENGGIITGKTLQQLLEALPDCLLRTDPLPAALGWTENEEKVLLRTWKSLSSQAPDHIPGPSTLSTALRQAGVWRSEEQCRSKVETLLRLYMTDVFQGGTGSFPFYKDLHDILGYDFSTAAFKLQQCKWELLPTAKATAAPDLGWAEDVFVLLGPSGQGALANPKEEEEKEEELVIPAPSRQKEPAAPQEVKLVHLQHFGQGQPVVPEEGEEAELVHPGHFGLREPAVPEEVEEAQLFHPEHVGQGEFVVLEGEEEADFVLPGHFGLEVPVVPEEGEEAQLVHPDHFGVEEPVVPEEEEAEVDHPGHLGQGEPVVPEEEEDAQLVHLGHFCQEPVVLQEEEEAEVDHPGPSGQGDPIVPEVAQHLVDSGIRSQGQVANLPHLFSQRKPEEGGDLPGSSGQETKSTPEPRDLDTPDFPKFLLCPKPLRPRCYPHFGHLGTSFGYRLCCPRYELPPRFSRRSRSDPPTGPSTGISGPDPCPGTSRNSSAGPLSSGFRLELQPISSASSGCNVPGAGLGRRLGSPAPLGSSGSGRNTGEDEELRVVGAPTQPPSAPASQENLVVPLLLRIPRPGLPMLLLPPPPFRRPLPPDPFQQGPPFPLPEPVFQVPLLYEAPWAPVSAASRPLLPPSPASFLPQDPLVHQALLSPPYTPPFQQPPTQTRPFFSQPFPPPDSFHAQLRPEGHFLFPSPPPGTAPQVFVYPPPLTPYHSEALPMAFSGTGPFSLYSFQHQEHSAQPLDTEISLQATPWRRKYRRREPQVQQPPSPGSLWSQFLPLPGPSLPPLPLFLAGHDPDGVETPSSAASLAPKPTSQPGSPLLSPPQALPQAAPLSTNPLPPLVPLAAPSGAEDQAKRPPPLTPPAAPSLPSGSPPQLPRPPSQPVSPGSPTAQHPPDVPPRLSDAPPLLLPALPPLPPVPLPSDPGAPDSPGNSPPPLSGPYSPQSSAPSLGSMSPPGHSSLSPPELESSSSTSPSSPL